MRKAKIESGIVVSGTHIGSLRWNEKAESFVHLAAHALFTDKAFILCGNIWAPPDAILQNRYPPVDDVLRRLLKKGLLFYVPGESDYYLALFDTLLPTFVQADGLLVDTGDMKLHIESGRQYGGDNVLRDVAARTHGSGEYGAVIFGGRRPEEEIIAAVDSKDRPSGHDGLYISVGQFLAPTPTFVRFDRDTCSLMRLTKQGGERFHGPIREDQGEPSPEREATRGAVRDLPPAGVRDDEGGVLLQQEGGVS